MILNCNEVRQAVTTFISSLTTVEYDGALGRTQNARDDIKCLKFSEIHTKVSLSFLMKLITKVNGSGPAFYYRLSTLMSFFYQTGLSSISLSLKLEPKSPHIVICEPSNVKEVLTAEPS